MARPQKDKAAAAHLGRNLRALKKRKAATTSFPQMSREIWARNRVQISDEQLRRYHIGDVDPNDAALEHLAALAAFYDVGMSGLHVVAYNRLMESLDLLKAQSRCTALDPGQPFAAA